MATQGHAERLVGLWALASQVQQWIGVQTLASTGAVATAVAHWTTTGRLSVWARGQLAVTDPHGRLGDWLTQVLTAGATRIAAAPPWPRPQPTPLPLVARRPPLPGRQAA